MPPKARIASDTRQIASGPMAPAPSPRSKHEHDHDWAALRESVQQAYNTALVYGGRMFQTDARDLYDTFLHYIPEYERQVHRCRTCRRFMERFGGLVTIDDQGRTTPVLWDPNAVPRFYRFAVRAVGWRVERARVRGVFLSEDQFWGSPETGNWDHLAIVRQPHHLFRHAAKTAHQAMAEKREDFKTVTAALDAFSPAILTEALRILEADAVNRAEKFVAPVKWLLDLHKRRGMATRSPNTMRENSYQVVVDAYRVVANHYQWRQVASAPDGFCHPRASVVGSLLEDIEANLPFEDVRKRFNAKVHPLLYQRPQAAPAAGNIAAAEKLIEKMGIAKSLERRFARLDELELLWRPRAGNGTKPRPSAGVFDHLKPKGAPVSGPAMGIPLRVMTWVKFARDVLPGAEKMEVGVPYHGAFTAFLTAKHADAPLIFKWGNTVSSYTYHAALAAARRGPTSASHWNLVAGTWTEVTGVSLRANMWGANPQPYLGTGAVLILKGAADTGTGQGNGLFPEILHSDLKPVAPTIEAYSKTAEISGRESASACGLAVGGNGTQGAPVRVTVGGKPMDYVIDRWE